MKYYLRKFRDNSFHEIEAKDKEELYKILKERDGDEVRINGWNYDFITHHQHHLLAGYPVEYLTIEKAVSPAHFNLDFYFILLSKHNEEELDRHFRSNN